MHGPILPEQAYPDWTRDFGRAAPLHLEIGFGKGGFLVDFAARHPEVDLVGIEIRREMVEHVRRRARRLGLANVALFHGDARLLVPRFFPPGSLHAIHVLFPDPWWKRKHHKRRMVEEDFARVCQRLLRVGGEVDFRSDVEAYARAALAAFEEDAGLLNAAGPGRFRADLPEALSTRERRYAERGTPVWRLLFVKRAGEAPPAGGGESRRAWEDVRRK